MREQDTYYWSHNGEKADKDTLNSLVQKGLVELVDGFYMLKKALKPQRRP